MPRHAENVKIKIQFAIYNLKFAMVMFDTSRDILNVVLAVCSVLVTVFLVWTLYYLAQILRNANRVATSVRLKLELVDKILNLVKDKMEKGASHLGLIADSAIKLVSYFIERQAEKPRRRATKQ